MKPWPVIAAIVMVSACAHDPAGVTTLSDRSPPRVIGLDSLRAVNGADVPCCGIVGGALTFYYPSHPTDYIPTPGPGGLVPKACVIGVPNGELVSPRTGVGVSADGATIPILPCTTGEYRLAVRDSGGRADEVVTSGTYTWTPDSLWHSVTLSLEDSRMVPWVSTEAHGDTIQVSVWGKSYLFQVISGS